jgi:DNA-binding MarR family transcriptional regulator
MTAAMQDLSERLVMERTTLVRAIKPLSRDGYIQQLPDAGNARKRVFSLTAEGAEKYREAHAYRARAQAEFEASVGKTRARTMRAELIELTSNRLCASARRKHNSPYAGTKTMFCCLPPGAPKRNTSLLPTLRSTNARFPGGMVTAPGVSCRYIDCGSELPTPI